MLEEDYPKVLVVDDKQENLFAIKAILKNEPAELILVDSARKGLEEVLKHDFCLILLDVQMPVMNGYEMAQILNEEESTNHIPIIFLTAIDEDENYEMQAYEAGAVDVIFKPLKSNRIIQRKVEVFLRIYNQHQKIKKLKDIADAASKSKAMFLANMSHEIRTPLNAILGFSELLKETELTEEQSSFLHHVSISGDMLFDLINDILDFSKIEAGTIELEKNPINLKTIIADTIDISEFRSQEKNLYLKLIYPDDLPSSFYGDETRIRQILINLINNALKFTTEGGGGGFKYRWDWDWNLRIGQRDNHTI
jgi:signal transduction histidine kinase